MKIIIDAMGGDFAPEAPVRGALLAREKYGADIILTGRTADILRELEKAGCKEVPQVIIVEGILIFQDPTLRDMFDIKIFVETDADVRILRRALRDIRDRGRTLESVITQYLTTVKPMHEQFVEPSRKYADIIVLEGGHNLVALDMIMQRIASHIASED